MLLGYKRLGKNLIFALTDALPYAKNNGFIMQNICSAIEAQGLQCEMLVGHSDFHVDIAVVNPYEPTKYLMGILLDGDGYRQTKNTRDREIAQIGVCCSIPEVCF